MAKLDRLTRSVRDLGELIEGPLARAALLSVAEQIDTRSAGGRLLLNVLASVSQWEREAIGERTSSAMRHLRAEGRHTGGEPPFGFSVDEGGRLVAVDAEQGVMVRARELRGRGLSLRAVARMLDVEGHRARSGKRLHAQQVARMLGSEAA